MIFHAETFFFNKTCQKSHPTTYILEYAPTIVFLYLYKTDNTFKSSCGGSLLRLRDFIHFQVTHHNLQAINSPYFYFMLKTPPDDFESR